MNKLNVYKQLALEFAEIENLLKSYDKKSYASNILSNLQSSIEKEDKESTIYCLDVIINWYENNMNDIIHSDDFSVFPEFSRASDHDRAFNMIKQIREEMSKTDFDSPAKNNEDERHDTIIFLSHKSDDKQYGHALEEFISGLGVKRDQLIYTSHPLHKIPSDENIFNYLRKNINGNIFMIILWSDKYLDSPACMNEMGAAWIVQCDYTNIYVPNFSFGNPKYHECAVDTQKMGAVLNGDEHCKQSMIELKNKIQKLFNLENDEKQSSYLLDKFIKEIKEIMEKQNNG